MHAPRMCFGVSPMEGVFRIRWKGRGWRYRIRRKRWYSTRPGLAYERWKPPDGWLRSSS